MLKNLEGIMEERTKNIQNINEMSIENFRNKIFNKKKDKNISDNPFEDIKKFDSTTDKSKNFSEKINRLIKYGSPILWKRNSKKKDLEKIYKLTGFTTNFKSEKDPKNANANNHNISNISHKDSFSYNKLLYWKNSINKIEKNDNENSMLKEEIVFTNQSHIDELNYNNNNNNNKNKDENDNSNRNYYENNFESNNISIANNINIKEDAYNFSKLEVDKQAYHELKEELNNQFFCSRNINNNNNNYFNNINNFYNYNNNNNKSRFLRSIENANISKLNCSSIFNNKENLNLSNQYPNLNQNLISINNNNNNNNNNNWNGNNFNYNYINNYSQSFHSPKFNNKDAKEIKFDSTLNSFKDLKNIHESAILYGEYQENVMTTTVNDIKFIDLINRNKSYICKNIIKIKIINNIKIILTAELIQFTENLPEINDNFNNNNLNNFNNINNYFNTNQTINESIEHILPENDDKLAFSNKKLSGNFPIINDLKIKKSKSQTNFYRKPLNTPDFRTKISKNKINFLLSNLNNNNKSSIFINSSSSGNIENSINSVSVKSGVKSNLIRKKNSKINFLEEQTNMQNLLNKKENKKNDIFGIKLNWKIAETINETKDYCLYKIFNINNSNTLVVRSYKLNIKKLNHHNYFLNMPTITAHNRYSKSINNLEHLYHLNTNSNSNSNNSNSNNSNSICNSNKSIIAKKNSFNKKISEFEAFKEYEHKNITKLVDYEIIENVCFLYFEYIPGKSLKNVLQIYGSLSEQIIKKYLKNIIEGIFYLRSKDIRLKNLKSSNILLELTGNVKLTDFIDYKSIIEFFEIYENSNFKNLRNSERLTKHPFPWMLKSKANYLSEKEFDLKQEIDNTEKINLKYLGFLMLEMQTGNNENYLKECFPSYKDGCYDNDAIKDKSFAFPSGVSEDFIDLFYAFFQDYLSYEKLENDFLKHKFFEVKNTN